MILAIHPLSSMITRPTLYYNKIMLNGVELPKCFFVDTEVVSMRSSYIVAAGIKLSVMMKFV